MVSCRPLLLLNPPAQVEFGVMFWGAEMNDCPSSTSVFPKMKFVPAARRRSIGWVVFAALPAVTARGSSSGGLMSISAEI